MERLDERKSSYAFYGEKTGNHRCVCNFTLFQSVSEQRSGEAETASDELMSRANRPVQGPEGKVKCKRPIRIWTGQEIFYSNSVIRLLEEGKLLTLADSNYVLVEFMPSVPYSEICTAVRNLSRAGYTPVVAHAERYRCLRKGKRVEELIDLEALIQMNYRSVSGGWHDATARWCKDNLKKRNIHFMGTDMHNIGSRMPDTKEAMGWMRKHLDSTYLRQITRETD